MIERIKERSRFSSNPASCADLALQLSSIALLERIGDETAGLLFLNDKLGSRSPEEEEA